MPTTVHTFNGTVLQPAMSPDLARTINVKLGNSLTLAAGTVLGRKASDNKWYAYSDAASDGTQVARAILQFPVATDSSGNHFIGATSAVGEHAQSELSAPAYYLGDFNVADLTGLDAAGVADLGRLIFGDDVADAGAVLHIS